MAQVSRHNLETGGDIMVSELIGNIYNGLSALLLILLVGLLLTVLAMFVADVSQSRNAVRHNYPVIGRFSGPVRASGDILPTILFCHGS